MSPYVLNNNSKLKFSILITNNQRILYKQRSEI